MNQQIISKAIPFRLLLFCQPSRAIRHKPWVPRFRKMRHYQPWPQPIDIRKQMDMFSGSPADVRAAMQREGMMPHRHFIDRPINISHSGRIFDPYIPPEADGKASLLSKQRASQEVENLKKRRESSSAESAIQKFEPSFSGKTFAIEAENIYKETHNLLQNVKENEGRLFELVTEKAFLEMTSGLNRKTLRWRFVGSVEPARVIHMRNQEIITKANQYAQVTVRFFTQQTMAIYDRFGRLVYGSEAVVRDILEYLVFEKHISDEYSRWRIHGKLQPDWMRGGQDALFRPTVKLMENPQQQVTPSPVDPGSVS